MSLELFQAVQAGRALLEEGHRACAEARARRTQTARPLVACRAIPDPAADGEPKQ